jgi:hypothetical protein
MEEVSPDNLHVASAREHELKDRRRAVVGGQFNWSQSIANRGQQRAALGPLRQILD